MTIGCPDCGALEEVPPLGPRMQARCVVCDTTLERTGGRSIGAALACALATFLLLLPANLAPLMTVGMLGDEHGSVLGSGVVQMWRNGWVVMAVLMGLYGIVFPLIRFGLLSFCLGSVMLSLRPPGLGRLYRWTMWLDLWAMPDVFLIGVFIGYERVHQHLDARIGLGGFCFIAAALLTMLTRATLDRRRVWRSIAGERIVPPGEKSLSCTACDYVMPLSSEGQPCPRCALTLRTRKPDAVVRAAALSLAALLLYLPANIYPMTSAFEVGQDTHHRIIDGVRELFQAGLWPLGIIIFCTSIAIPGFKLVGMGWFVSSVLTRSRRHLKLKTFIYKLIDELGRWSNVDVFTLVVFVPLIQFDGLASARPEQGGTAFSLVVTLTLAASRCFDARLMWDAAEKAP
jgi:paraquat-inducible protein A